MAIFWLNDRDKDKDKNDPKKREAYAHSRLKMMKIGEVYIFLELFEKKLPLNKSSHATLKSLLTRGID